ncbi:MAG: hypothetical protein IPI60_08495 [Saprospiraceae bacterium]|nr:hypothetical protein [Saprospiraceae bacterium]
MKVLFVLIILVFLIACGVPQAEYDKVVQRADSLQTALDAAKIDLAELTSEPDMMLNEAKLFLSKDKIESARLTLEALLIQYPTAYEATEANQLLADLNAGVKQENADEANENE